MLTIKSIDVVSEFNPLASFSSKKTSKHNKAINLSSLEKAAQTLECRAQDALSKDRVVNTARKATMADSAESEARKQLMLAKTIFRLVDAIKAGETKYLSNIRTKVQVELLQYTINYARKSRVFKLKLPQWETNNKPVEEADAEFATYPYPSIDSYQLKTLFAMFEKIPSLDKPLLKLKDITCYVPMTSIVFDTTEKLEVLQWIVKELKASNKYEAIRLVDYISRSMSNYQRFCQIGITDLPTLIQALKEYCRYCSDAPKEDPIKKLERELIGSKIRSYFPTPKRVAERMLQLASIEAYLKVLEPSAGKGSIADLIKENYSPCNLSVIEINYTLRDILKAKGYNLVGNDFLEHTESYDRIVQNPPFEGFQDIAHCYKAFSLLKAGGRLVSIVSEACFFRSHKQASQFRSWLEEVNAYIEKLPDGSFLESERSTGVAARIVAIDKPHSINNTITEPNKASMDNNVVDAPEASAEILSESLPQKVEENSLEMAKLSSQIGKIAERNSTLDNYKISDATLHNYDYEAIKEKFLEHQQSYQSIIMTPALNTNQNIEHIYHAYYLVNPGGTVAISLPQTLVTPTNKPQSAFHKWLKILNATIDYLADGMCLVVIKKTTLF